MPYGDSFSELSTQRKADDVVDDDDDAIASRDSRNYFRHKSANVATTLHSTRSHSQSRSLFLCLSLAWLRLAVLVLSCCCCCCVAVAVAHKLPNKGRHMWTEEAITSAVGYANRLSLDFRIGFNGNQRMLTNCSSPRWSKRCKIGATLPGGVWRRPGVDSATAATTRRVASQCVASCNIWQRWQRMLTAF